MRTPSLTFLRGGQPGDICLLLETDIPAEIAALRQNQASLKRIFGGQEMELVHLTCQRFILADSSYYPIFFEKLKHLASGFQSFTLHAQGLVPLYSPYRKTNILKWEAIIDPLLVDFSAQLEKLLDNTWSTSLYSPGSISTWVTALVNVNPEPLQDLEQLPSFPHPLFTPRLLTVSKLLGPSEFEIMDRIPLWKS
jgi:hypothetical protein